MTTERIKLDRIITRTELDDTTAGALNLRYADGLDSGEPTQAGRIPLCELHDLPLCCYGFRRRADTRQHND